MLFDQRKNNSAQKGESCSSGWRCSQDGRCLAASSRSAQDPNPSGPPAALVADCSGGPICSDKCSCKKVRSKFGSPCVGDAACCSSIAWYLRSAGKDQGLDFIEVFAGSGSLSAQLRRNKFRGVAMDVVYGKQFDILSSAGMLSAAEF